MACHHIYMFHVLAGNKAYVYTVKQIKTRCIVT